jgi:hypothetical protein
VEQIPDKLAILKKYSRQDPQLFYRFDGIDAVPGSHEKLADDDGHILCASLSPELVAGSTVRLLIKEDASRESVLALLDKIRDWIAHDEDILSREQYKEQSPIIITASKPITPSKN